MDINRSISARTRTATFSWNTEYAVYVHEGATFRNGRRMPARPWTKSAIADFEFEQTFGTLFNRYGDFDKAFKETCFLLGREFTEKISSEIWQWTDGGLRDIVDTGQLRASQQLEFD